MGKTEKGKSGGKKSETQRVMMNPPKLQSSPRTELTVLSMNFKVVHV